MFNFAINNEAIQVARPIPLLTDNFIYKGYDVMAKQKSNQSKKKKQLKDFIGMRFGRLLVVEEGPRHITPKNASLRSFACLCDCGNTANVFGCNLMQGNSKSCGCLKNENTKMLNLKHGLTNSRIYKVWANMKSRCYDKNNIGYAGYGGRRIIVHKAWKEFIPFYDWAISHGYSDDKFIDRKNVNGNYEPENCRFVSNGLSHRNTRTLRRNNSTGYRGVNFNIQKQKYEARIMYNKKCKYLGGFADPISAAKAYDSKARELNDGRPLNFN